MIAIGLVYILNSPLVLENIYYEFLSFSLAILLLILLITSVYLMEKNIKRNIMFFIVIYICNILGIFCFDSYNFELLLFNIKSFFKIIFKKIKSFFYFFF